MKKILIILMLFMVGTVYADVEIDTVKFYVDNERISGPDEDGGEVDVYRSDTLDMLINVMNNYENETDVKIFASLENIDDGEDIEKDIAWFEVQGEDDKSKSLSFYIPDDAAYDNYDLELKITYKNLNNTEFVTDVDYTVNVVKIPEPDKIEERINFVAYFDNITAAQNSMIEKLSYADITPIKEAEYLVEITNLKNDKGDIDSELSDVKYELDKVKTNISSYQDTIEKKDEEIKNLQSQLSNAKSSKPNTVSQEEYDAMKQELEKKNSSTIMWGLIIAGAGFVIYQQKKKKNSVGESLSQGWH